MARPQGNPNGQAKYLWGSKTGLFATAHRHRFARCVKDSITDCNWPVGIDGGVARMGHDGGLIRVVRGFTVTMRRPVLVHVLFLPTEGVASHVADRLRDEGFDPVDVIREDAGWAVRVCDPRLPDTEGSAALKALTVRFEALAEEHEGRYVPRTED